MKRLVYPLMIGLLLSLNLKAQEVNDPVGEFMGDNTWFLTKIVINGEEIPFEPNNEVEQSTFTTIRTGDGRRSFGVHYCITGRGGPVHFPDDHHFTINEFIPGYGHCSDADNSAYQANLFGIFEEPNINYPFFFTITEEGDLEKMVITGDNGNQAYYQTDSVLSVEKKRYRNLKVYPNPAGHYVSVANITSPITLKLYDLLGHQLHSRQMNSSEEKIDLDGLPPGIYIYKLIQDRERVQTGKLVKK